MNKRIKAFESDSLVIELNMLVVELVLVFVVNFAMNKMRLRVKKKWIISQE